MFNFISRLFRRKRKAEARLTHSPRYSPRRDAYEGMDTTSILAAADSMPSFPDHPRIEVNHHSPPNDVSTSYSGYGHGGGSSFDGGGSSSSYDSGSSSGSCDSGGGGGGCD